MSIDIEALKASTDIVAVVGAYVALKKQGAEYKAQCPFHADATPSFYVIPNKRICHCFGCGWTGDVIDFLQEKEGIDFKAACDRLGNGQHWTPKPIAQSAPPLPDRVTSKPPPDAGVPEMETHQLGEPSRVWPYRDAAGEILGYVARYETPEGKQIRCWTWGARGSALPAWGCGHWSKPRPLYGLDRLAERPHVWALVVEGEKACDAAIELLPTYACITWPGGANAWKHADWEPLRGRNVLLWPDADEPGAECMARLADMLANNLGCTVKIINPLALPEDLPEGWDLANALAEGWTTDQVITWAKDRVSIYDAPQQNPAPQVAEPEPQNSAAADNGQAEDPSSLSSPPPAGAGPVPGAPESLQTRAGPPPFSDTDFPAGAQPAKPRKRRLKIAGGRDVDVPSPEAEPGPHELSESGIATHFVALHKDKFRTVHEWAGKQGACWMAWDGSRWRREPSRVTAMQRGQALAHGVKYWDAAKVVSELSKVKFESRKFIGAFLDLASYAPDLIATPDMFDADPMLLGTPAGTVDLRIGKVLEPEREHYITRQTSVSPAPGPHPLFDDLIRRAAGGEADMAAYLWNWLGYLLTGLTKEKAFLYAHGKTDSGKTTLATAIANIMGNAEQGGYAAQCDIELFTDAKVDRGNDRLAHLAGARFAYASEMEEGKNFKTALLKLATGNDALHGRFLYAEQFSFTATHKLWIFGNHQMHMKSSDKALLNRMHLLEYKDAFIVSPEERDNDFQEKLKAEYPAILASMIQASVRYLEDGGLGRPERISQAVDEYAHSEDTLGQWIAECVDIDATARATAAEAYQNFGRWADKEGAFKPSAKRFGQQLVERGFARSRPGGVRSFVGFSLRLGGAPAESDRGYEVP